MPSKKLILFAGAAFALAVLSNAALAGEFTDWCVASAPDGADMSKIEATCSCLEEATDGDAEVRASMQNVGDIEDRDERFAALSAEAQEAVASCR